MALDEQGLENRRAMLREKLRLEEISLQEELQSKVVKPEQFRKQRAEKARLLSEQREKERKMLAKELIMKQWCEGCDPLRHLGSKQVSKKASLSGDHAFSSSSRSFFLVVRSKRDERES